MMSAIRIKVDEDLPTAAVELLHKSGCDAVSVLQQEMSGWKDHDLWQVVQGEGRLLLTADKGFGDARIYPPGKHCGIILLRPDEDGVRPIVDLLRLLLAAHVLSELAGTITVVTPRGVRIRR